MRILTPLHNPARLQPQISHCQLLFHTALKSLTHLPLNSLHSERLDSHTGFLPYSKEDRRKEDNPHQECPTRSPFSLQQVLKQPGALAHPLFLSIHYTPTSLPILPSVSEHSTSKCSHKKHPLLQSISSPSEGALHSVGSPAKTIPDTN